jgi:hypothetical protein
MHRAVIGDTLHTIKTGLCAMAVAESVVKNQQWPAQRDSTPLVIELCVWR